MDERTWAGANPYYLLIVPDGTAHVVIDLDERGWLGTLKDKLGLPGVWHLVRKEDNQVIFSMRVWEGDQPYYTARHIGIVGGGGGAETVAYGIGKKTRRMRKGTWHDNEDNLWILPWGQICGGTDVEYLAAAGMKAGIDRPGGNG